MRFYLLLTSGAHIVYTIEKAVQDLPPTATRRQVIRRVRSIIRPEAKTRAWRDVRRAVYRKAIEAHAFDKFMARVLSW